MEERNGEWETVSTKENEMQSVADESTNRQLERRRGRL